MNQLYCRNPTLGLSVRRQLTLPKVGKWSLCDSQKLRRRFEGSNLLALVRSLYQGKALEAYMFKMASHCPFGHLQPKLWAKEEPGVKLPV
jgi:hypothetical protein